jgi:glycosyltransferase involved in cell wall biosynthesis
MTRSVLMIHFTPPGVVGGVESVIYQHAQLLEARGWNVRLVAGRDDGSALPVEVIPTIDAAREASIALEAELAAGVVSPRFWEARAAVLTALMPLFREAEVVIAHNALTLHFSLPLTAALWSLSAAQPGKLFAWTHDLSWTNPLYLPAMHAGYPWNLLRLPAPGCRYALISQERLREVRMLWPPNRGEAAIVPNGVDVPAFLRLSPAIADLYRRLDLSGRDAVLLLPVRITRRKNVELGIRATAALAERGLDVIFLVSGPAAPHHPTRSASYLAELKELRAQLGVEDRVRFLADERGANLSLEQVWELYSLADVLLFPSAQEGFGLPVVEAAVARVPIVLSDIPIFREVGGDEARYVGLDWSADRIAEIIEEALGERLARAYRRVLHDFAWDRIVDRDLLPLLNGDQPGEAERPTWMDARP